MKKLILALCFLASPALAANYSSPIFNNVTVTGTASTGTISGMSLYATGGSTTRTLAAHFSDVIYARDRGVKCDGVTADTAAINAITQNLASNTEVIFPPGTCVFLSTLTWRTNNSSIIGSGRSATIFNILIHPDD